MSRATLVVTVAAALFASRPRPAGADDTHYQDQIVGEDALGMGGAFTAVADDASAAFYNPAGLANIPGSSLSGSLSVYGYERREIEDGFQSDLAEQDLEHDDFPTRAIGGGVVKRLGTRGSDGQRPFALAFSTFVPFQSSFRYSVAHRIDNPYPDDPIEPPILYSDRAVSMTEDDQTVWVGPSFAYRLSGRLSVGVSAFLSTRTLERAYDESWAEPTLDDPDGSDLVRFGSIITSSLEMRSLTGVLRFGVLYAATPRLRVGLMLSPPSIPIAGSATFQNRSLVHNEDGTATFDRSRFEDLAANAAMPANARAGIAYLASNTMLFAFDASLHLPLSYTSDNPLVRSPIPIDNYFVTEFDRKLTPNFNIGFETLVGEHFPFRLGAFTNFSSAPAPRSGTEPMQPKADMVGGSFAVGYRDEGYDISVGAAAMFSFEGRAQAYVQTGFEPYVVQDYEQTAVYIYLTGAKKAAGQAVRSFVVTE